MMRITRLLTLFVLFSGLAFAESAASVELGTHVLFGGRYDNLRMCVGSPEGVKGGPIGEVYLDFRFPIHSTGTVVLKLPVFRPILFGIAFRMLQFEPQIDYEYVIPGNSGPRPVLSGGVGAVFHYGPDYNSSTSNRSEDFFAAGPLFSLSAGVLFKTQSGNWAPGIKFFYSPLFANGGRSGTVAGGALELHYSS